jgi:hypothetical protein
MNTKSREFWIIVFVGLILVFGLIAWGLTPIVQQILR